MPINAEERFRYPIDWPEISRRIRHDRAGGRCEVCLRPHGGLVLQDAGRWRWIEIGSPDDDGVGAVPDLEAGAIRKGDLLFGRWITMRRRLLREERLPSSLPRLWRNNSGLPAPAPDLPEILGGRISLSIIQVAHLDHVPENNRDRNLMALCGRCHMRHDRFSHQVRRRARSRKGMASGDLFDPEKLLAYFAGRR